MVMANQLISESMWHSIAKIARESECHCQCGETFFSLAHYVGKKTRTVTQLSCPSCGRCDMDYVIPQPSDTSIPSLSFTQEE